jgi:hypothetical protein
MLKIGGCRFKNEAGGEPRLIIDNVWKIVAGEFDRRLSAMTKVVIKNY